MLDWDELWPDAEHVPEPVMARDQRHLHGLELAENGDIVFNFTEVAMLRVNPCGDVVWRLAELTHHSVDIRSDGNFWVPGLLTHTEACLRYPAYLPDFVESTLLHVSSDGKLLKRISMHDLLTANGRRDC